MTWWGKGKRRPLYAGQKIKVIAGHPIYGEQVVEWEVGVEVDLKTATKFYDGKKNCLYVSIHLDKGKEVKTILTYEQHIMLQKTLRQAGLI